MKKILPPEVNGIYAGGPQAVKVGQPVLEQTSHLHHGRLLEPELTDPAGGMVMMVGGLELVGIQRGDHVILPIGSE